MRTEDEAALTGTAANVYGQTRLKANSEINLDLDIRLEPVSKPVLNIWLERNMNAKRV